MNGEGFVCNGSQFSRSVVPSMIKFMPAFPVPVILNPVLPRLLPVRVNVAGTTVSVAGALVSEPMEFVASTEYCPACAGYTLVKTNVASVAIVIFVPFHRH
jgi:hypothetical protein